MASNKQMLAVAAAAIAVAFLPLFATASVHLVGDEEGWTLGFNYTAWSKSNQFMVGEAQGNQPFRFSSCSCRYYSCCITHRFLDQVMLSHDPSYS
jgi:hypothetical protein